MQLLLILVCVAITSISEAATIPKLNKPGLTSNQNESDILVTNIGKLPEERRQNSLFPKTLKKFVVTPRSQVVKTNPTRATKKPLMRKLSIRNKPHTLINPVINPLTEHPFQNTIIFSNNRIVQKLNLKYNKEENSIEVIKEDSMESKETINSPVDEINQSTNDMRNEEINMNKETAIKPTEKMKIEIDEPKKMFEVDRPYNTKRTEEMNEDNVSYKITHQLDRPPGDMDKQMIDRNEFIFANSLAEKENEQSSEENSEEFVTSDYGRVKRSDNMIEEENLGTTLSTYKFTWDSYRNNRLTDNLMFKNINS